MSPAVVVAPLRVRPRLRVAPMVVAVLGVTALGAVLRFWALGRQGLWYDEAMTAWLLRGSPAALLSAVPHTESTPPLYYLVAWGWARVFGDTAIGLRSLSAVAGTVTVPVAFAAGRGLVGRRAGLTAAVLVAVSPLLVWYSQEARAYALLALVCAVSLWLLARVRTWPSIGRHAAWAAAAVAAMCTHYFAAFVVAPQALLVLADRRAPLRRRLAAAGVVGAAGLGLAVLANAQRGHTGWIARRPLVTRTAQVGRDFVTGFTPPAGREALAIAGAGVLVGLVLVVLRADGRERRGAAVAAAAGVVGVGLPLAAALGGLDYLDARNVLGALVPLSVVVAAGLGARRAGFAGVAATAAIVGVSVALVASVVRDPAAQRPGWNAVAAALAPHHEPRAILLDGSSAWGLPLASQLRRTWWMPRRGARVREIDLVRRIPSSDACSRKSWWGPACALLARPAPGRPPAPGFRQVSARRVAGFEIVRYRAAHRVRLYPHRPYERPGRRHGFHRKHLLLTPRRVPAVP